MRIAFIFAIAILLSACGNAPPRKELTREQWIATTQRVYPDVARERVLAAAERVLRLADGDDFKLVHREDGFDATRVWLSYAVILAMSGTDYWIVRVADAPAGGVRLTLGIGRQTSSTSPMSFGNGWMPVTSVDAGVPVDGPAAYEIFFARLDYLLGKRPEWLSCTAAEARAKARQTWGNDEVLCNSFNVLDQTPNGPLP